MSSFSSISYRAFAALSGVLMLHLNVSSQCNPPEQLPTNYCQTAPLICLQNACYETIQDNFPDCCSGWCEGNYLIHNPQFFEMIATSTTIEIHLDVIGCDDGTGLQGAIIDACPWATTLTYEDIVECDGDAGAGTTMILILDTAIIGQSYWFMIDGYGGALCNYTVSFVSGILNPPLVGELDPDESMAIPNLVCQGYGEISVVASPAIGLAHGYMWITEWNNETIISTLPEITMDITDDMPPGIWDICIIPFSGCDTLEELCIPLEVVVVDDGLVEAFHCLNENFDPYVYEGEDYYSSGDYDLLYPEMGLAECDSMAVLHLTMVGVDAFIELTCSGSDFVLAPIIQEVVPANAIIDWAWYESGSGFEISGDSALHTTEDGCYDLFATIEVPEGECEIWISGSSFCFDGSQYIPTAPEVISDTTICAQPGVVFEVTNASVGEEITYVWSAPPDVPAFQNDTSVVEMDFSNSAGGEVCVYVSTSCGVSPPSCFTVSVVNPLLAPDITCTSTGNSILFDWNDIGSPEYIISLDQNTPFSISVSEYLMQPLNPGSQVHLLLTLPNQGPCPILFDSTTCIAQNCDPPSIVISGIDSVCLNDPFIVQPDAQVNGSQGMGTWTGSGIIDNNSGVFDPTIAGAGVHTITFTTIVNSCPFSADYAITVFDSIRADFTLAAETCVDLIEALEYTGNASAFAIYNYDFDGAIITFGSGAGPYRLYWTTPGLKTITLQVMENGCVSEIFTRQIRVDRELEPPVINCTSTDSTIVFSFILDPNAFSHDIAPITTQPYQSINNTIEFSGLSPGEEVIIEFITFSGGKCPNRVDTFSCIAKSCPMVLLEVDPVNDICLYPATDIVQLSVNVTGGTGTGTGDWSGPGVVDAMNGRFDPNVAGAGSHQINYHFLDDGCEFNDPITINVYDVPVAAISNTNLIITCTEPSLFLDGSGSSGTPLLYSWTTDTGTIMGLHNLPIAEATAPGVYQLLVTNAISGCKDSISVTVTVDANIPIAKAGPDKTITCDSIQFELGGASTTGSNIIYLWATSGGGNIVGPANGPYIVADRPGDYTIIVRDTSTGCETSDQVTIGIDTITAIINLVPGDTIDCSTTVTTITSTLNESDSDYTFDWSTLDGIFSGITDGPNVNVQQGGLYTLTIHNIRNGCEGSADVFVHESDEIIDDVVVTQRNVRCFGEANGALIINAVTGGLAPYDFTWSVSNASGDSLTQLSPGSYTLTVTDQNGCSLVETYTITEPAALTLDIGPNLTVAAMDSVIITLSTNVEPGQINSIDWSGIDSLQCSGCFSIEFIASLSSTIIAIIMDTAGCIASDSMKLTITLPRNIFIPNIFSPNDDGVNDMFSMTTSPGMEIITSIASIFDRWGNLVFSSKTIPFMWNGTFKNKALPPGVYAYKVLITYNLNGFVQQELIQGDITLVK